MSQNKDTYLDYPEEVTETFDEANFHIKYCLSFIKKYLKGEILEVGAGCGSFTRNYFNKKITSLTLTEKDKKNILRLSKKYSDNKNINVLNNYVSEIEKKFDVILYLHVLEHIKEDEYEIRKAVEKLNDNGILIIMVPAHQSIYSNLDKNVGHHRRYDSTFFKRKIEKLSLINFKYLDSSGYFLYFLNRIFFKKEEYPSKFKIFIWDKIFTPISAIIDFILRYKVGKCILAVYKKN